MNRTSFISRLVGIVLYSVVMSCATNTEAPEVDLSAPDSVEGEAVAQFVPVRPEAVAIDSICTRCDAVEDTSIYTLKLYPIDHSLGYIRIRSDLTCFETACNNLISEVSDQASLLGLGPLKNQDYSAGPGYAVLLQQPDGLYVQGFVSASVVKEGG